VASVRLSGSLNLDHYLISIITPAIPSFPDLKKREKIMRFDLKKTISSIGELFDGKAKKEKCLEESLKKLIKQTDALQATVDRLTSRMESLDKLSNRITNQLLNVSRSNEINMQKGREKEQQDTEVSEEKNPEKKEIGKIDQKRFKIEVKE
jgi:hypothetical protein